MSALIIYTLRRSSRFYLPAVRIHGRVTRYPEGATLDGLSAEAASGLCTSRRRYAHDGDSTANSWNRVSTNERIRG